MALSKSEKDSIKKEFGLGAEDSGSTEVQVALLTERIRQVTEHLSKFKQDNAGKRGLLKMVAQRRTLLKYLTKKDPSRYKEIIKRLGLKK